jgi:tetrapyrrole methylase family protein/MazG family protein
MEELTLSDNSRKFESGKCLQKSHCDATGTITSILSQLDPAADPLIFAQEIQTRVSGVGFDWKGPRQALPKVYEELEEVSQVLNEPGKLHLQEELGDLIFSVINLIRISGHNAYDTLASANNKFIHRFNLLEAMAHEEHRDISFMTLEELEELWEKAKVQEENAKQ